MINWTPMRMRDLREEREGEVGSYGGAALRTHVRLKSNLNAAAAATKVVSASQIHCAEKGAHRCAMHFWSITPLSLSSSQS